MDVVKQPKGEQIDQENQNKFRQSCGQLTHHSQHHQGQENRKKQLFGFVPHISHLTKQLKTPSLQWLHSKDDVEVADVCK